MLRLLAAATILAATLTVQAKEVLPFIEDDYQAAVTKAKAKNVPLFVEAWAPW